MGMSPTALTLALLRDAGYIAEVVEHYLQFPGCRGIRRDLFQCIDIVAAGDHVLGAQATSWTNHSARLTKCLENEKAHLWVKAGGKLGVYSWRKSGSRYGYAWRVQFLGENGFSEEQRGQFVPGRKKRLEQRALRESKKVSGPAYVEEEE